MGVAVANSMRFIADGDPAGGAPLQDVLVASLVALAAIVVLSVMTVIFRQGGLKWLRRLGRLSESATGLPSWAGAPILVSGASVIVAAFGFYWDVATHIDNGRDAGPFANPAHFFILFGLVGVALGGYLSGIFATEAKLASSIRIFGWHFPIGGGLLLLCGSVALAGFPLDDVWHRLFGQDVTLWGPTHIQMVGGASLSTLAMWILLREGEPHRLEGKDPKWFRHREIATAGAFLIGMSTLQAEFDFAVPQFRLVYQPILLMIAASVALVAARVRLGRGGAIKAVLFYLAFRALLSVLVGPVLGRLTLHFPLYIAEALVVEAAASLARSTKGVRFASFAGTGIGTVGLAAEWGWSHVWMMNPWPAALLPEASIAAPLAALGGAFIGMMIGNALQRETSFNISGWIASAAMLVVLGCIAYAAPMPPGPPTRAHIELERATSDAGRAYVQVRLEPAGAAEDALWFHALAWQGLEDERGASIHSQFEEIESGVYRSLDPIPVSGDWKALIRLHVDDHVSAVPIYLPEDPGIPAPEVPAEESSTRSFVPDKEIVQREATGDNVQLQRVGYTLLAAIGLAWIASIGWGLRRLRTRRLGTAT
jgi:hypothetical protein